jgi:hypothetical protein
MWKKIAAGIVVLLILAAGIGYYLLTNLDSFVKSAIEKYGSAATQTAVTAGSVQISLTAGTGSIAGLTIANPPGYSTPLALSLGHIAIALDTSSLTGQGPIIINSVTIEQPLVTYEVKGLLQGSNLQTLQSNIQSFANSAAATQAPSSGPGTSGAPLRKEIIRDLTITGGQLTVLAPGLTAKQLVVPLPPLHLTDLGGPDGATPAQIGAQVLNIVMIKAAGVGADALARQSGSGALSKAGTLLKGLLGQ